MDKVIANTEHTVGARRTRRSRPVSLVCFLVGFCYSLSYLATPSDAAWTQTNGLYFCIVYSLAINPQNPLVVYAGTRGSGVFKSMDGGQLTQESDNARSE